MTDADVIIIGGGAAGMFAGCLLAEAGTKVIMIEPNRKTGRKLRITGKGRCNVTNNCTPEDVIKNTLRNPKFLYSSLYAFPPEELMRWFEKRGVPLKTERGKRVFPVSDSADDIADTLERVYNSKGGMIIRSKADGIVSGDGSVCGVKCGEITYFAPNVILATGGLSYPKTGSTGDGYRFAKLLGHTVTDTSPSLVPIVIKERFVTDLSGLTLKNVTLNLYDKKHKKPIYSELGELMFMPYGIAGPLSLSASCYLNEDKLRSSEYSLSIDLKPGLTREQLIKRIQRDLDEANSLPFKDSLSKLLPLQLIDTVVSLSGISPEKQCNQVKKEEKEALCDLLKSLQLTPYDLRPVDEAIITRGGVSVKEINTSTMESKLVKGLYFAGEIIDVDAFTGGFNLQIAFSTAFSAANAIINLSEDN